MESRTSTNKHGRERNGLDLKTGRKTIYWITVGVFIIAGAGLTSLPGIFSLIFRGAPHVASVNGLPIPLVEYRERVQRVEELLSLYRHHFGIHYKEFVAQYLGGTERPTDIALEELITEKLALSLAQQIPLALATPYITRELSKPAVIQSIVGDVAIRYLCNEHGSLNRELLRRYVGSRGFSMQEFETLAEERLASNFAVLLAQGSSYAAPARLERELLRSAYTRHFELTTIDLSGALRKTEEAIPIADAELRDYFEERNRTARTYWSPERRSGTAWRFELADFRQQAPQPGADRRSLEQRSSEHALPESANLFVRSAEELLALSSNKQLISFIGEHRGHALTIRHVKAPPASQVESDPLAAALFSLDELHGRSVITKKEYGYIIELTEISAREPVPFEEVRDEVLHDLRADRVARKAQKLLAQRAPSDQAQSGQARTQRFTIPAQFADQEESIPLLQKLGLRRASLDTLLHVGDSLQGLALSEQTRSESEVAYQIVLVAHEQAPPELEEKRATLHRSLQREAGALQMRVLIASLREHAIITMSQAQLEQRPSEQAAPE